MPLEGDIPPPPPGFRDTPHPSYSYTLHCSRVNWIFPLVLLPAPENLARRLTADKNTSVIRSVTRLGLNASPCAVCPGPSQCGSQPRPRSSEHAHCLLLVPRRPVHSHLPSCSRSFPPTAHTEWESPALVPGSCRPVSQLWRQGTPPCAGWQQDPQTQPGWPLYEAGA